MDTTTLVYILTGTCIALAVATISLVIRLKRIDEDIQEFKKTYNHNGTAFDFRLTAIQEYLRDQLDGSKTTDSKTLH